MPQLLQLPQFKFPDNADVSKPLMLLGEVLGKQFETARNERRLLEVGKAAQSGGAAAGRDAAYGAGMLSEGLKFDTLLESKANRASDESFREKKFDFEKSSSDRNFGLKEKELNFEMGHKNALLGLKRMELEFKNQGGFKDLKERAEVESGLRKEFSKHGEDFVKVRDAFERVKASATDPSAAGDMALIFNYMKILDPGSTVREGEYATAQQAGSVGDRVRAMYNSVLNGEKLAPTIRNDFVSRSGKLFQAQEGSYKKLENQFIGIGNRLGVDVRNVVIDQNPAQGTVDWKTYFGGK